MTNAQAALQAAALSLAGKDWPTSTILRDAETLKQWLDEQDEIDRKKKQAGAVRVYGEV